MKSLKSALLATAMTAGSPSRRMPPIRRCRSRSRADAEEYQEMGFYLRGDIGWSFLDWGEDDNALTVGGGVGYQFNDYLRSDVRVDWSGDYDVGADADLNMTTVLGNLYFDFPNELDLHALCRRRRRLWLGRCDRRRKSETASPIR